MQVLLLGLFVALYLHDATTATPVQGVAGQTRLVEAAPADVWPALGPIDVGWIVLVPKLLLIVGYWVACRSTYRRLGTQRGVHAVRRLEAISGALPILLLGLFAVDLWLGALRTVRLIFRHVVLVDELIVLLPTLAVATWSWWAYYPVDRRLREAVIFRQADAGEPVYPVPSRGGYVLMQARHQFGLLLLPLLAVFAWSESLALLGPDHRGVLSESAAMVLMPIGVLIVFVAAPLVIRYVWQTVALPPGEVRERMLGLCARHGVKVRELLLWRTGGGMVNAAVTGLISPVRFILLSDGLLDRVEPSRVEAVMAHELAHVKCRHIVWMGLTLIVTLGLLEFALGWLINAGVAAYAGSTFDLWGPTGPLGIDLYDPQHRMLAAAAPAFAVTLMVFGYVSRRIERQADVFAAKHMAQSREPKTYDAQLRVVFDQPAIDAMVDALQRVAELNHAPVQRKSWRHGSIAWRQAHLRSLVGTPIHDTAIDRTMNRIKLAVLVGTAILIAGYVL